MTVAREEGLEEGIAIGEAKGIAIGEARGIAIGEAKGKEEGIKETARSMLAAGIPPETVSHCTKLSIEEIAAIQEDTDLT
ncbi:MAG: hypothetical protein LBD36_01195, partial [Holosporales bacterium]|jgi:predicted transposase YdaD|nr:hypothetical protein [Holosporales bacterium]